MENEKEWCKHIKAIGANQAVWCLIPINHFADDDVIKVSCDWDYCPICGVKRPMEALK